MPPTPDPEQAKLQMEAQQHQAQLQLDQQKMQQEAQGQQAQHQMDREKMGQEKYLADQSFQLEQMKMGQEQEKMKHEGKKMDNEKLAMRLDAKTKVAPEVAMSDPDMNDGEVTPVAAQLQKIGQALLQGIQQMAEQQQQANQALFQAVTAPKKTEVIRGPDGRISGGVSTIDKGTIN